MSKTKMETFLFVKEHLLKQNSKSKTEEGMWRLPGEGREVLRGRLPHPRRDLHIRHRGVSGFDAERMLLRGLPGHKEQYREAPEDPAPDGLVHRHRAPRRAPENPRQQRSGILARDARRHREAPPQRGDE